MLNTSFLDQQASIAHPLLNINWIGINWNVQQIHGCGPGHLSRYPHIVCYFETGPIAWRVQDHWPLHTGCLCNPGVAFFIVGLVHPHVSADISNLPRFRKEG